MDEKSKLIDTTFETQYASNTPLPHRKKYAQFFTPNLIADIMSDWILKSPDLNIVLDPAFGLGVFARSLKTKRTTLIKGFEIDKCIYNTAKKVFLDDLNLNLILQDYMFNDWNNKYDGIICNPPYLKFHNYDNKATIQELETRLKYKLSGSSNLYVLFLLKSIYQLSEHGFLAYIIPSEFMNSDYGVRIKEILVALKVLRHIVIIDFNENIFGDAVTTSTILLCSKDSNDTHVTFSTIHNFDELDTIKLWINKYPNNSDIGTVSQKDLQPGIKWRKYYQKENASKYKNLVPFSTYAKVKRGIATGSNNFFVFNKSKQQEFRIPENGLLPCICKSTDVSSIFFTEETFKNLKNKDKGVYILNAEAAKNDANIQKYIKKGELDQINSLYLTSNRSPWFAIEKRDAAPILVSVFNREGMKFIRNEANIKNLTTFHCVYPNEMLVDTDILFAYLTTNVAQLIFDDSRREYGNGLKKFEPNDLNKAQCVNLSLIDKATKQKILSLLNEYKQDNSKTDSLSQINDIFVNMFLA